MKKKPKSEIESNLLIIEQDCERIENLIDNIIYHKNLIINKLNLIDKE